jgi:hypothetical protein
MQTKECTCNGTKSQRKLEVDHSADDVVSPQATFTEFDKHPYYSAPVC